MLHNKIWIMRLKKILGITFIVHFAFYGICFAGFYRYNVDDLSRKAQKRLQEIDKKIAKEELKKEVKEILAELQSLFDEAESLLDQKKYEEAADLYREIDRISSTREVKKLLEEADK